MKTTQVQNESPRIAYFAWSCVALFFLYQYILRVSPGVMINDLRHAFNLTADQFSTLGALYLYAYSLLQIPIGVIVDRVGVRRTVIASVILCILGAFLTSKAQEFWVVQLARVMIGAGSACAFMCSLKVVADRLPPGKRGFLTGATLTLGTVGALSAGRPQVMLLDNFGWRSTVLISACLGFIILVLAFLLLPKRQSSRKTLSQETIKSEALNIISIFKKGRVMLYAMLAIGLYTPLAALADLWGTAFFAQKFGLERANAAHITMMMYLGLSIGSLFLPWFVEKYNIMDRAIQICSFAILAAFAFLLYGPVLSEFALTIFLICIGLFCGAEMICFSGALLFTNKDNSGATIGVVNTLNMLGGAILQRVIGYLLDYYWSGAVDEAGLRVYSTANFIEAMTCLLVIIGICAFASLRLFKKIKIDQSQTQTA